MKYILAISMLLTVVNGDCKFFKQKKESYELMIRDTNLTEEHKFYSEAAIKYYTKRVKECKEDN